MTDLPDGATPDDSPRTSPNDGPTDPDGSGDSIPAIQRFYENIWLWAILAILFWAVSYLVWGYLDLISLEAG